MLFIFLSMVKGGVYMFCYNKEKGIGTIYILVLTIVMVGTLITMGKISDDFIMTNFLYIAAVIVFIYQCYYFGVSTKMEYILKEEYLEIKLFRGLKKVKIYYNKILEIRADNSFIKGIHLLGVGKRNFAFGRFYINKIGTCRMFVTNNEKALYIKTPDMIFGISPDKLDDFKAKLLVKVNSVETIDYTQRKVIPLHKDKYFIVPFLTNSLLILINFLLPLYLYYSGKLKVNKMPVTVNEQFYPVKWVSTLQFLQSQLLKGVFAMLIFFCIYYVSHIYAKYDRKASYWYMYIPMVITGSLLIFQIILLKNFN